MIEFRKLPAERWKDLRGLRLEALQSDPLAFASSYEEEKLLKPEEWKKRVDNTLFALSNDTPVGMIVYIFNDKIKTNHIANVYGVYVKKEYRGQGIGNRLVVGALRDIQQNPNVTKIHLTVTAEQTAAIALYKKNGFIVVGKLEKELQIDGKFYDEFLMERFL
jgi:ribosomal protein S18 acetylase RimI-like enzyme